VIEACPYCDSDVVVDCPSIYGIDVHVSHACGECFCTFAACCEDMQNDVETRGYEATYGASVGAVVEMITGYEVLEVLEEGDGTVVCRLRIVDPTIVLDVTDKHGHPKASSPAGWQGQVFADVAEHHRHHEAPAGHKFSVAVFNGPVRVGVAVVGHPQSRLLQKSEPDMLEVTRVATWGHAALRKNAVSKLYAAAGDRARSLRFTKLVTYTLHGVESGHSLVASGWKAIKITRGEKWDRPSRSRPNESPDGAKVRWQRALTQRAKRDLSKIPPVETR
jgi:hypothetical protein